MKTLFSTVLVLCALIWPAAAQFSNTVPGAIGAGLAFSNTVPQVNNGAVEVDGYGDSYMVQLALLGWYSHCLTNNSIASAQTNQADGSVWYNTGSYLGTNLCLLSVFTNLLFQRYGIVVTNNNGACVPGQWMCNIFGGMASSNTTFLDQSYSGTYNSAGTNLGLIQGNWTDTWWPGSTNDISITFTNGGGVKTTIMNTNNNPVTFFVNPVGYTMLIATGTVNAAVGNVITLPLFAGQQNSWGYPWNNNGNYNNTTNNIGPGVQLITNAPNRTGVFRIAFLMAGGNEIANGRVGNTNILGARATNQVQYIYSNQVAFLQLARSTGHGTILGIYPQSPSQTGYSLTEMNMLRAMETNTPSSLVDGFFYPGNVYVDIGDQTHPAASLDGWYGTNAVISIFNSRLLPKRAFLNLVPQKIGN